jgi:hypothetical protein
MFDLAQVAAGPTNIAMADLLAAVGAGVALRLTQNIVGQGIRAALAAL